jgi:hypothetical protein
LLNRFDGPGENRVDDRAFRNQHERRQAVG